MSTISPLTAYIAVSDFILVNEGSCVSHYSPLQDKYNAFSDLARLGRRRAKLKFLDEFWALTDEERERITRIASDPKSKGILLEASKDIDEKNGPEDEIIDRLVGDSSAVVGIVVRTDYSNESAWTRFVETVKAAEKELNTPETNEDAVDEPSTSSSQGETQFGSETGSGEDDGDTELSLQDENTPAQTTVVATLVSFVSPPGSDPLRARLIGASNLTLLRLFDDVSVQNAPSMPPGSKAVKPGCRLIDMDGLVEAYEGLTIWVYDSQSNSDNAVRLVSLYPGSYGSATLVLILTVFDEY